jgi:hypothetical protein
MNSMPPKFPRVYVTSHRPLLRSALHWTSSVALAVLLAGCSGDDAVNPGDDGGIDASGSDATAGDATGPGTDAGVDASLNDAGSDAAATDAGSDASSPDAGSSDAGFDAGNLDAANPDSGFDAGHPDAGSDGGGLDAGDLDGGTGDAAADANDVDAGSDAGDLDAAPDGADDASSDAGEDAGDDAGPDASSPVTYALNAQPIFQAKCAPCHTTLGSGGVNFASVYADTQKAVNSSVTACTGLNVGACTIIRIKNGQMPRGAGCTGNPTTDQGNAKCLTQAQEDVIQAWVDDGELP